jgi:uncharacterized membrane protein YhaH (DUF805 family)
MPLKDLLFSFNGRIRRSQYWRAAISLIVGYLIVMSIIFGIAGAFSAEPGLPPFIWAIDALSLIPLFWCGLAIAAKRWHDRGKSGFMVLVMLIPVVGPLLTLMECGILDGTPGPNRFGPSPKDVGAAEVF